MIMQNDDYGFDVEALQLIPQAGIRSFESAGMERAGWRYRFVPLSPRWPDVRLDDAHGSQSARSLDRHASDSRHWSLVPADTLYFG